MNRVNVSEYYQLESKNNVIKKGNIEVKLISFTHIHWVYSSKH